ncbi:hypothetical protein [Streptomyces sp. UG1]|uniref:hypothetical protein n=1 Tax=Streptomyces sp. UG1 TaxID=3417652 RepID=UPI003CEA0A1B
MGAGPWKLECRQHFEEQGSPSGDAVRRGEWERSLRVVEKPVSPYVQWELAVRDGAHRLTLGTLPEHTPHHGRDR